MASSDDPVEQQLFAEILASAKKVQHQTHEPPSSLAIQSANLLNAARLHHRHSVASAPSPLPSRSSPELARSSPAAAKATTRAGGTGKLKPVGFLREDLAKRPRVERARRGDPYELGLSSPEKAAASAPAKLRQKAQRVTEQRVQQNVSADSEILTPSAPPERRTESRATPPGTPPVSIIEEQHAEEVPETPSETSGRPRSDSSNKLGRQPRPGKRKAGTQTTKRGRPAKVPRKNTVEVDAGNMRQSNGDGPRAPSPKVVVPSADHPVRITRAQKSKPVEANPPELDHHDEPPQSAQKPPEQDRELRGPQPSKRRKVKRFKPLENVTGLDIPSDIEATAAKTSRTSAREQQVLLPPGKEQRRSRQESRLKISETVNAPAPELAQNHKTRHREQEPRSRKGDLPQSSKSLEDENPTAGRTDGDSGVAATKQTRSKAIPKSAEIVPVPATRSGRSQSDTSQQTRSKKHRKDAQDSIEPEENLQNDPDEAATAIGEHGQSEGNDLSVRENDDDGEYGEEAEDDEDNEDEEDGEDGEEDEINEEDGQESNRDDIAQLPDMEVVFKFLEYAEHRGDCQTEDALAVKNACQIAIDVLEDDDSTLDEVSTTTKHIQKSLRKYGASSTEDQRKSLKIDAYAYLFRQVVRYLEALYFWLSERYRVLESSLDAMRIITPLVDAIVTTKDRIAEWRVPIPTRYKGARLIKDVDSDLVVPLRRISEPYRTALRQLKEGIQKRRAQEELAQKHRKRTETEDAKREMEEVRKRKLCAWIDLHVCRLRMEPSVPRRMAMSMKKEYFDKKVAQWADEEAAEPEERDSNGKPFLRVGVFKKRDKPPASSYPVDAEKEWTDEQTEALVEGLQEFAGPYVFPRIFEEYCGVGRPLRKFGVPEITAKAIDMKVRWLRSYQENGWEEVPKWIRNIPRLP